MKELLLIITLSLSVIAVHAQNQVNPIPPEEIARIEGMGRGGSSTAPDIGSSNAAADQAEADMNEGLGNALGQFNNALGTIRAGQDFYEAYNALSPGECMPDFAVASEAMVPSSCNADGACAECYTSAYNELAFLRRTLARLSCIYNNTKNFNQSAIAFGDNVSGIHAVTGLAWQTQRGEIIQAMNEFKQAYDNKYKDLMESLKRDLMRIDACERQYGQPDWFQRFGFMYFDFMQTKYKRAD